MYGGDHQLVSVNVAEQKKKKKTGMRIINEWFMRAKWCIYGIKADLSERYKRDGGKLCGGNSSRLAFVVNVFYRH